MDRFEGQQITRVNKIELTGSIEKVFPLFTPIEEKKWVEGWEPTIIYPANEEVKEGMVFKSRHIDEHLTYWIIIDYKPDEHFIQYVNVAYDYRSVVLKIKCIALSESKTEAVISYCFTGLSQKGNEFVVNFTEDSQKEYIESWQKDINKYLSKSKQMLK